MFENIVLVNLWDLVDAGIDATLDRIQATGATAVSVVVTSRPVASLRVSDECSPRVVRDPGGFFFKPDPAYYQDTQLKPLLSPWLKQRNPLDAIANATDKRQLQLRLRISAFQVGQLAERHPQTASKNVFGDVATHALCPAHPDVRALLRSTVADLSERYVPSAIEIDDLVFHSGSVAGDLVSGVDYGESFSWLLGICFSEASRQWAVEHDADPASAARWVRVKLDQALGANTPMADSIEDLVSDAPLTRAYLEAQTLAIDTLIERLASATGQCSLALILPESQYGFGQLSARGAASAALAIAPLDGVRCDLSVGSVDEIRKRLGIDGGIAFQIEPAAVCIEAPQELVRTVRQSTELDLAGIVYSHWSQFGQQTQCAIRQAVRFASRSAV